MTRYPQNQTARNWETGGLIAGLLLVVVNGFALLTPYLAGPVFHPVLILIGVLLVYACAMALGGVSRDLTEQDY